MWPIVAGGSPRYSSISSGGRLGGWGLIDMQLTSAGWLSSFVPREADQRPSIARLGGQDIAVQRACLFDHPDDEQPVGLEQTLVVQDSRSFGAQRRASVSSRSLRTRA